MQKKNLINILQRGSDLLSDEKPKEEDENMKETEIGNMPLEEVSSYYRAISNPKRLKILLALRENFIDGMKWSALRELTDLSSGALKRHIDILTEVGLIGKSSSNYRITQSGLELLTQIDEIVKKVTRR